MEEQIPEEAEMGAHEEKGPDHPDGSTEAIEAAAFRRLLAHLAERTEVQNIDLMNLAGFCRNCLAKWYREAAVERGLELSDAEARERVYGMPYAEWKARYQTGPTVALSEPGKGPS